MTKVSKLANVSIQTKILILVIISIILVTTASMWSIFRSGTIDSSGLLKRFYLLEGKQKSEILSSQLHGLEELVSMLESYLTKNPAMEESQVEDLVRSILEVSPLAFGSAIAYEPFSFSAETRLYSPYAYRSGNEISVIDIGNITDTSGYDYSNGQWEWWTLPKASNSGVWTAPYFDEGAGNALMTTFSSPFFNNLEFRGVVTVDVLLESIFSRLSLASSDEFIVSSEGNIIFSNIQEDILTNTLSELDRNDGHENLNTLLTLASEDDNGLYTFSNERGETIWGVYNRIPQTGWIYIHLLPENTAKKITAIN